MGAPRELQGAWSASSTGPGGPSSLILSWRAVPTRWAKGHPPQLLGTQNKEVWLEGRPRRGQLPGAE